MATKFNLENMDRDKITPEFVEAVNIADVADLPQFRRVFGLLLKMNQNPEDRVQPWPNGVLAAGRLEIARMLQSRLWVSACRPVRPNKKLTMS